MRETLIIRGRLITPDDLTLIHNLIQTHWQRGRKFISKELCRLWQWYQPNGRLKDMAAREILLRLQRRGFIELPPSLTNLNNSNRNRSISPPEITLTPLQGKVSQFGLPELKMVRHTPLEPLYNSLIHHYHYLGYRQTVGAHLSARVGSASG